MHIRVWQSYSCNNSSSFRLVARFANQATAKATAEELSELFKDHATQGDEALGELYGSGAEWPPPPTKACLDLAKKYGFKWDEWFHWGDGELSGDEPTAISHDDTVLIYHGYCNGFPSDLSTYLKARGATKVDPESWGGPDVSVLFKIPTGANKGTTGKKLEAGLAKVFAQAATTKYLNDWKLKPPWSGKEQSDGYSESVAFFSDGKTIGFYLPISPKHLDKLKEYLAKEGVTNPSIRLSEASDCKKFQVIAAARCDACKTPLSYIDPRTHEIDAEQLACEKCGGMFDLASIIAKHDKAAKAATRAAVRAAKAKTAKKKNSSKKKPTTKRAKKKTAAKKKTTTKKAAAKKRRR